MSVIRWLAIAYLLLWAVMAVKYYCYFRADHIRAPRSHALRLGIACGAVWLPLVLYGLTRPAPPEEGRD